MHAIQAGSSFSSSESPWPTFGLGKHHRAKIKVTWPSGLIETYPGNPTNSLITLIEGSRVESRRAHEQAEDIHLCIHRFQFRGYLSINPSSRFREALL